MASACRSASAASRPATRRPRAGDCDDGNAAVNPGVTEVCDGIDNNCVNGVDEEDATGCTVWARDHDGDGYGAVKGQKCLCATTGEYTATTATDCNDNDKAIHPKALEVCDGVDNDCDGKTDPPGSDGCNNWFVDKDGDGYGTYAAPSKCLCEGGIGFSAIGGDCNDANAAINPDATEVCNGLDDNCDQVVDPANTSGCTVYYSDADSDGYGVSNLLQCACSPSGTFTATQGGDCKDSDAGINPGQTEICNSLDDNCNGQTDEGLIKPWYTDVDKDGFGVGSGISACGASGNNTAVVGGDCDDTNAGVNPGKAEDCATSVDDNCNGAVNEGCATCSANVVLNGLNYSSDISSTTYSPANLKNQWWLDSAYLTEGSRSLTFESPNCTSEGYNSGTQTATVNLTVPTGTLFVAADVLFDNRINNALSVDLADTDTYMVLALDGATQQIGPFPTIQNAAWKLAKWPITGIQWGQTLSLTVTVYAKHTTPWCLGGFAVDNIRTLCN